jgi:hypothetical protein
MNDDIIAISPDTVFISGKAITEEDALGAVDTVLKHLHDLGDMTNVDTAIDTLLGIQRFSGKALAKLLHGSLDWWKESKHQGSFNDYMESRHGLKGVVIDRYITVWDCVSTKQIPENIAVRPMRELIPIAKAISQGNEISQSGWNKLMKANGLSEIGSIIRKIKNKPPRKGSAQIYWERDGSITVWKNNKRKHCGWLDKEAFETDEVVRAAINRILDNAGVIIK